MSGATVWKFPLQPGEQRIGMPAEAVLLHVAAQHVRVFEPSRAGEWDEPCIWALVDPSKEWATRRIAVHGTGHNVQPGGHYVGTFHMDQGALVWHVFDHGEVAS